MRHRSFDLEEMFEEPSKPPRNPHPSSVIKAISFLFDYLYVDGPEKMSLPSVVTVKEEQLAESFGQAESQEDGTEDSELVILDRIAKCIKL